MPRIQATAAAVLPVSAAAAYAVIADYRHGHPRIVPPRAFGPIEVESGGVGEGTVFRFSMRAFGQTRTVRAAVTEPEPGRVLVETVLDSGLVTTFTVNPAGPDRCGVTIDTVWESPGARGWVERAVAPRFLRKLYAEELESLARVAAERAAPPAG